MLVHLIRMDSPDMFSSIEDFTKKLHDLLPGNLYGENVTIEYFEKDGTNFRDNKVTVRISVN